MILKRFVVPGYSSNSYIVGTDSGEGIIVDAGGQGPEILETARQSGLEIKLLVLTHGHFDHIGAAREIKEASGCQVAIHREDAGNLGRFSLNTIINRAVPPHPEGLLEDGELIEVGELSFRVLHTPGHTPGGICLYGEGVVFTGDTLFRQSVGRTDIPGGSHSRLLQSIRSQLLVLPDETVVLPGHGPESTIGGERSRNPFLNGMA